MPGAEHHSGQRSTGGRPRGLPSSLPAAEKGPVLIRRWVIFEFLTVKERDIRKTIGDYIATLRANHHTPVGGTGRWKVSPLLPKGSHRLAPEGKGELALCQRVQGALMPSSVRPSGFWLKFASERTPQDRWPWPMHFSTSWLATPPAAIPHRSWSALRPCPSARSRRTQLRPEIPEGTGSRQRAVPGPTGLGRKPANSRWSSVARFWRMRNCSSRFCRV